jgi:hypothetical protein
VTIERKGGKEFAHQFAQNSLTKHLAAIDLDDEKEGGEEDMDAEETKAVMAAKAV